MAQYKRLRMETLEARIVLNAAPVLVKELHTARQEVDWRAWSDDKSHVSLNAVGSRTISYSGANATLVQDFTGDEVDDVLMQWPDGQWGLQVNDGQQLYLLPWGKTPDGNSTIIDTADFNNDGLEDILSYDKTTGDMWVSLNSLSEGFSNHRWSKFTPETDWLHFFVDDFDGDGFVDVLGGESGGGWWLAKNVETTFHNYFWGRFGQHDWQDVVSDDFTGDGLPDVAARGIDNTWWMWNGSNDKLEVAQYWGHWKMRDAWHDVSVADFNNDGRSDLIGRSEDGLLWIGDGANEYLKTTARGKGWVHGAEWSNMSIVDMNGDGLLDQVGQANDSTWWYAENTGERFRNHYWQKGDGFVASNFTRDLAIDLQPVLAPDSVSQQSVLTEVSLTLDDNDRIVISGSNVELFGINLESKSGSLVPANYSDSTLPTLGNLDDHDEGASPFQFFLANSQNIVAMGSLNYSVWLNGSITLNVGWDTNGVPDLIGLYGGPVDSGVVDVDDRLDSAALHTVNLDNNFDLYRRYYRAG